MKILAIIAVACVVSLYAFGQSSVVSVATQHNNLSRNGWNKNETQLTTKNVSKNTFGVLFTRVVDDQIYAQPLVVAKVVNFNVQHTMVFVATVNNTVYAFDGDILSASTPYWQKNLTPSGARPPKSSDMTGACGGFYSDFSGSIGIVGTPVIDTVSQTLYVVARDVLNGTYHQYLHALDIRTGDERPNSPVLISAQVNGNGVGSSGGSIGFNSQKQNQRPGLLLLNGTVYIGFASHCDWNPYHGWLLGYNASTLQQTIVYNTSPEGEEAGIWMSGAGPSADELGNIYIATGNGTVGISNNPSSPVNRGESALKLVPNGNTLSVASFFTPSNYGALEQADLDFGVTAMMLIPNSNFVITGSKDGYLFLLDRNNMGGYSATANNVLQTINIGRNQFLRSSLSYYKGASKECVYTWSENAPLLALPFNRISNTFDIPNATVSNAVGPVGNNGALLSVSSRGSVDSTAILWASHAISGDAIHAVRPGILRAFDALDVKKELWNSSMDANDNPGNYAKFVNPTIANGKVYLATFSNKLMVYGLVKKIITGIDNENEGAPRVYPNPAPEQVSVRRGAEEILNIYLFDSSGRQLKVVTGGNDPEEVTLPLSDFSKGLYILLVKTAGGTYRYKIVH